MKLVWLLKLLGLAGAAMVFLLGLLWLFQRKLIYFPLERHVPDAMAVLEGAEEIAFTTADGLQLGGWFLPAASPRPLATVLVFNGNAGNRSFRAPLAAALAGEGLAVMLFDYRGYGGNPGKPTENGLLQDARAAREWLESRDGVDARRVVLFGESLGAAVALASAVEKPPAALVLRSPFTSLTAIARRHYPFLPVRWLLADRYPSVQRVERLQCPLLVIAGDRDRIVPEEQSRQLFDAAPPGRRRFLLLEGGHNDMELLAGDRLIRETAAFIRDSLPGEGS